MKKAIYKVPNGKLLKIFLEENDGKISKIRITGDFFIYPEENIEKLELFLVSAPLASPALSLQVHEFFMKFPTELFGVDETSLVSTILQAHSS